MHEAIKIIGGVLWALALLVFLVSPTTGLVIGIVALVLSVRSVIMTRERRHRELLNAQKRNQ